MGDPEAPHSHLSSSGRLSEGHVSLLGLLCVLDASNVGQQTTDGRSELEALAGGLDGEDEKGGRGDHPERREVREGQPSDQLRVREERR